MSFAQHVSAAEGADRDPDTFSISTRFTTCSSSLALGRRLSYDPLPFEPPPTVHIDTIGAYEVSSVKRFGLSIHTSFRAKVTDVIKAQLVFGIVACVLASGIVFGFAALKSVLVDEGVYRNLCTAAELHQDTRICFEQDLRLNLTFIIASITTNVSALPVGALLDRYGPRVAGILGCIFITIGTLFMAFASNLRSFDAYPFGSFFLSLGGTCIFVPSFHLSNAFPRFQGLILALITGAFDASAAIFFIFRVIYDSSDGSFKPRNFFLIYLSVPAVILVGQLILMPSQIYQTIAQLDVQAEEAKDATQDVHDSDDEIDDEDELWQIRSLRNEMRERRMSDIASVIGFEPERKERLQRDQTRREASGIWGALHGLSAWTQIQTPWFILIAILTIITMARFNLFIATLWSQYRYYLGSDDKASQINSFFDLALPVGGIAAVPFIGLLLDNTSTAFTWGLLVLFSSLFGILGALPYMWAGFTNVVLFCAFRPFYYSAMSDYAAKVFGFATFGSVYGTIICISGLATFIQFPIQAVTHKVFKDNPTPVNVVLTTFGLVVGMILVAYLVICGRAVRKEQQWNATDASQQGLQTPSFLETISE